MPAVTRVLLLPAALVLLACSHAAVASDSYSFDYHGWHIDASKASGQPREALVSAVQKQIDGIETLGIAQDIVSFMRTVPLHASPSHEGAPARYERENGVSFRGDALEPKKPVLLPELLRAFREQKLTPADDEIIANAYEASRRSGVWPADAPMLKSAPDFFAATATVYLFGTIDTPPFSQGKLHEVQPEYWKWLGEVFDGFRGCEGVQP